LSDRGADTAKGRPGGALRWFAVGGWVVAALLLAHFVSSNVESVRNVVLLVAFWVPFAGLVVACLCGTWWSARSYVRREKGSLLWTRNGFVTGLLASVALGVAAFDETHFPRPWLAAVAAVLLASVTGVFAYASFREDRRLASSARSAERLPPRGPAGGGDGTSA